MIIHWKSHKAALTGAQVFLSTAVVQQRISKTTAAPPVNLMAQERQKFRRIFGRVWGRVN